MNEQLEIEELIDAVQEWAFNKGLIYGSNANTQAQMCKVTEEVGETARAVLKCDIEGVKDGIGDIMVTLIILAEQHRLGIEDCLNAAWNEIKNRKGKTVNGTFIKD